MERPDKSAAESWSILNKRAEKGPNFKNWFPPLILSNYIEVQEILPLKQAKKVFFFSPNSFKNWNLLGDQIFSSAGVFFFWTGRKVLQRVGNTAAVPLQRLKRFRKSSARGAPDIEHIETSPPSIPPPPPSKNKPSPHLLTGFCQIKKTVLICFLP